MDLKNYWEWENKVSVLTRDERKKARIKWNILNNIDWHDYLLNIAEKKIE